MLKRITIFSFALLFIVTGVILYEILLIPPSEQSSEKILAHETDLTDKKTYQYPTKQMRSGVLKDIWVSDGMQRLHHRIESPRSVLTAYPKNNAFELVEQMQGMKCYIQEKIEYGVETGQASQQLRFIESQEGTYYFANQHFDAHQVFLAVFRLSGDILPSQIDLKEAFLQGVADEVTLFFSDHGPNFHAEKFKAHIRPQGSGIGL